jgi:Flp pilus assembly protein TadD
VCCLLIVSTLWTYAPALTFEFVDFDDPRYVTGNPAVQAGLTTKSVWYACTTFDLGNWIPLTWLSLETDATLFGIDQAAFHAVNVAWHVVNSCLLYFVLVRMTVAAGPSTVAALLFALHPLHVESVAWVSERKDVLSTFWLLAALLAYERYARSPNRPAMIVVCVALALGLLAKPMLVTLPVMLLACDYWPLQRSSSSIAHDESSPTRPQRSVRALLIEKAPLILLALFDSLVAIWAQRSAHAVAGLESVSMGARIANAINSYGWYLWKTAWPTGLCVFYPHPFNTLSWPTVGSSALALTAVSSWVWLKRRQNPHLAFGWLWFIVSLLPVVGLLQVGGQAHADRYAYIPHIGLFTLIVWEAQHWLARCRAGTALGIGAAALVLVGCVVATRGQLASWRDSESLWANAFQVDADNPAAHFQSGLLRMQAGDFDAATRHLGRLVNQRPINVKALINLGWIDLQRHDWRQAAEHYAWALRLDPGNELAAINLATLKREHPESLAAVQGPEMSPAARSENTQGLTEARAGRFEAALRHFQAAIDIDAGNADSHNNAALALGQLNRVEEAKRHYAEAIRLAPDHPDFHFNFAVLLESLGDQPAAREQYEAVLLLRPSDVEARHRLEQLSKP